MDRRMDDRVRIEQECNIYMEGTELNCTLRDISEIGVAFEIPFHNDTYSKLQSITDLEFSYLDEFTYLGEDKLTIINDSCTIARIVKKGDKIILGCRLNPNNQVKKYVKEKKVSVFLEQINKNRRKK